MTRKKKGYTDPTNKVAALLGIDYAGALDVLYLRTKPRWTKKLEEELVALHKAGTPPKIEEFGNTNGNKDKVYSDYSPRCKPADELMIGHRHSQSMKSYGTFRFLPSGR